MKIENSPGFPGLFFRKKRGGRGFNGFYEELVTHDRTELPPRWKLDCRPEIKKGAGTHSPVGLAMPYPEIFPTPKFAACLAAGA